MDKGLGSIFSGPPQDIVDYFLLIQNEKQISEDGEEIQKLSDTELLQLCNDLFLGKTWKQNEQ